MACTAKGCCTGGDAQAATGEGAFPLFTEAELEQHWFGMRDEAPPWTILLFREGFFASRRRATVLLLGHAHGILCGRP